jgi:hypothetical protein
LCAAGFATWEDYWLTWEKVFVNVFEDFIKRACARGFFYVRDCLVNAHHFCRIVFENFRPVKELI